VSVLRVANDVVKFGREVDLLPFSGRIIVVGIHHDIQEAKVVV